MTNFEMLNEEELLNVNGGNWFTDAWNATCDWCEENKKTLAKVGCIVGGIALCAPGIGIGAAVGLVAVESVGAAAVVATTVGGFTGGVVGAVAFGDENEDTDMEPIPNGPFI